MRRAVALWAAAMIGIVLGGCVDRAPAYRQEYLAFDEGLVGTWVTVPEVGADGKPRLERVPFRIGRSDSAASAGRLGRYNRGGEPPAGQPVVPGYRISVVTAIDEQGAFTERAYDAVMLKIEGVTLLAYQAASSDTLVDLMLMDTLPVHRVARVERRGDDLTVCWMRRPVVWVPQLRPLYGEAGEARLPASDGTWVVFDPDHLTDVLKLAVGAPDTWLEPLSLKRE